MKRSALLKRLAWLALAIATVVLALLWLLNTRDETRVIPKSTGSSTTSANPASPALLVRGEYLTRAGNCMTCHTSRGGTPFAGGRGIETPFGTVFSSNLTPDATTGLGTWNQDDFWRALHNGRSQDGRLLYPAFPYTSYTQVSRDDADAMHAYLQSLPPASAPAKAHTLRWPFNTQIALSVWRALYFSPGTFEPEAQQSADWNRGAYLVRGLGHCAACHSARDSLGGSSQLNLAGGLIPMQNWYAPALTENAEAGVSEWPVNKVVTLLKTGVVEGASVLGPMAEVVLHSTQHMTDDDLRAMAVFLKSLPPTLHAEAALPTAARGPKAEAVATSASARAGAALYENNCAQCHGASGQGVAGAYPALAGNRAVTMASTANLVQIILNGGYAPATAGNPRPYGMPPFVLVLSDTEIANLLTFLRSAWGNQASQVTSFDVNRSRAGNKQR
jgi:mono/diheme cytochrome c family protein